MAISDKFWLIMIGFHFEFSLLDHYRRYITASANLIADTYLYLFLSKIGGGEHGQGCFVTGLEGQSFHGVAKPTIHTRETYKNASHHCCTGNQNIIVTPENRRTGHINMGSNLRDILLAVGQVGKG